MHFQVLVNTKIVLTNFFVYLFGGLECVAIFFLFERRVDSNPECCRSKQTNLATQLHVTILPIPRLFEIGRGPSSPCAHTCTVLYVGYLL